MKTKRTHWIGCTGELLWHQHSVLIWATLWIWIYLDPTLWKNKRNLKLHIASHPGTLLSVQNDFLNKDLPTRALPLWLGGPKGLREASPWIQWSLKGVWLTLLVVVCNSALGFISNQKYCHYCWDEFFWIKKKKALHFRKRFHSNIFHNQDILPRY